MVNKKVVRRPKKHNPTPLQYRIKQFSDYESITQMDKTKAFVYVNLIKAIKITIADNADHVELFNLTDYNSIICLKREDWKEPLNKAIEFFADKEMFEMCVECRNLISLLN
jgi:hypothetical protein